MHAAVLTGSVQLVHCKKSGVKFLWNENICDVVGDKSVEQ
jgi:hypothetical protein